MIGKFVEVAIALRSQLESGMLVIVGDKVGSATIFLGTIAEAVGYGASWASCGYFFEVYHLP